tara:strand:+ start:34 stop:636 length:603 start_codon:yes stop_codon:yes gene_type:complete
MGFDIYGLNPKVKEGSVKPEIDWESKPSKEEQKAYFEAKEEYQKENVGDYFRNNVWWWRRLAQYVYENVDGVCEAEEDYGLWHENSGHQVDEATALRIADKLEELIKQGHTAEYEMKIDKIMEKAIEHNAKIDKKMKALKEEVRKLTGKDLAPAEYPEVQSKKWDKLYQQRKWEDSYPFAVENVKEFADFCRHSGGFEIC